MDTAGAKRQRLGAEASTTASSTLHVLLPENVVAGAAGNSNSSSIHESAAVSIAGKRLEEEENGGPPSETNNNNSSTSSSTTTIASTVANSDSHRYHNAGGDDDDGDDDDDLPHKVPHTSRVGAEQKGELPPSSSPSLSSSASSSFAHDHHQASYPCKAIKIPSSTILSLSGHEAQYRVNSVISTLLSSILQRCGDGSSNETTTTTTTTTTSSSSSSSSRPSFATRRGQFFAFLHQQLGHSIQHKAKLFEALDVLARESVLACSSPSNGSGSGSPSIQTIAEYDTLLQPSLQHVIRALHLSALSSFSLSPTIGGINVEDAVDDTDIVSSSAAVASSTLSNSLVVEALSLLLAADMLDGNSSLINGSFDDAQFDSPLHHYEGFVIIPSTTNTSTGTSSSVFPSSFVGTRLLSSSSTSAGGGDGDEDEETKGNKHAMGEHTRCLLELELYAACAAGDVNAVDAVLRHTRGYIPSHNNNNNNNDITSTANKQPPHHHHHHHDQQQLLVLHQDAYITALHVAAAAPHVHSFSDASAASSSTPLSDSIFTQAFENSRRITKMLASYISLSTAFPLRPSFSSAPALVWWACDVGCTGALDVWSASSSSSSHPHQHQQQSSLFQDLLSKTCHISEAESSTPFDIACAHSRSASTKVERQLRADILLRILVPAILAKYTRLSLGSNTGTSSQQQTHGRSPAEVFIESTRLRHKGSILYWVCYSGIPAAVSMLLNAIQTTTAGEGVSFLRSLVAHATTSDGISHAFELAAALAHDGIDAEHHANGAQIVKLLAPFLNPSSPIGSGGAPVFFHAVRAGVVDVVRDWLFGNNNNDSHKQQQQQQQQQVHAADDKTTTITDPSMIMVVDDATLTSRVPPDDHVHGLSAFDIACAGISDALITPVEREAFRIIAELIATRIHPRAECAGDKTAFAVACYAGLDAIAAHWLTDPQFSEESSVLACITVPVATSKSTSFRRTYTGSGSIHEAPSILRSHTGSSTSSTSSSLPMSSISSTMSADRLHSFSSSSMFAPHSEGRFGSSAEWPGVASTKALLALAHSTSFNSNVGSAKNNHAPPSSSSVFSLAIPSRTGTTTTSASASSSQQMHKDDEIAAWLSAPSKKISALSQLRSCLRVTRVNTAPSTTNTHVNIESGDTTNNAANGMKRTATTSSNAATSSSILPPGTTTIGNIDLLRMSSFASSGNNNISTSNNSNHNNAQHYGSSSAAGSGKGGVLNHPSLPPPRTNSIMMMRLPTTGAAPPSTSTSSSAAMFARSVSTAGGVFPSSSAYNNTGSTTSNEVESLFDVACSHVRTSSVGSQEREAALSLVTALADHIPASLVGKGGIPAISRAVLEGLYDIALRWLHLPQQQQQQQQVAGGEDGAPRVTASVLLQTGYSHTAKNAFTIACERVYPDIPVTNNAAGGKNTGITVRTTTAMLLPSVASTSFDGSSNSSIVLGGGSLMNGDHTANFCDIHVNPAPTLSRTSTMMSRSGSSSGGVSRQIAASAAQQRLSGKQLLRDMCSIIQPTDKDEYGTSALHIVAGTGHHELVSQWILQSGGKKTQSSVSNVSLLDSGGKQKKNNTTASSADARGENDDEPIIVARNDAGETPFDRACICAVRASASVSSHIAGGSNNSNNNNSVSRVALGALTIARQLAPSLPMGGATLCRDGMPALYWATYAKLNDVVAMWMRESSQNSGDETANTHHSQLGALVAKKNLNEGNTTCFDLACEHLSDVWTSYLRNNTNSITTSNNRIAAARALQEATELAVMIGKAIRPDALCGRNNQPATFILAQTAAGGCSYVNNFDGATASDTVNGLLSVLEQWFASGLCTRALLKSRDAEGHTAFQVACNTAMQVASSVSAARRNSSHANDESMGTTSSSSSSTGNSSSDADQHSEQYKYLVKIATLFAEPQQGVPRSSSSSTSTSNATMMMVTGDNSSISEHDDHDHDDDDGLQLHVTEAPLLYWACKSGLVDVVKRIILHHGTGVNEALQYSDPFNNNATCFEVACELASSSTCAAARNAGKEIALLLASFLGPHFHCVGNNTAAVVVAARANLPEVVHAFLQDKRYNESSLGDGNNAIYANLVRMVAASRPSAGEEKEEEREKSSVLIPQSSSSNAASSSSLPPPNFGCGPSISRQLSSTSDAHVDLNDDGFG